MDVEAKNAKLLFDDSKVKLIRANAAATTQSQTRTQKCMNR
jgi:hypothetical protein